MKYEKDKLEKLIFIEKKSYREIGRIYNVSDTYIKKIASKLGIALPKRKVFPEGFIPASKFTRKIYYCNNCNKELDVYARKYCSSKCQTELESKNSYKDFLENNEKYCRTNYSLAYFKKYFLEEQNNKCAICNISNEWNNKKLVFVLDHIDGNASNNKRKNIRLVCPNCDSQLDTYKSKNKHSARTERYKLQRH